MGRRDKAGFNRPFSRAGSRLADLKRQLEQREPRDERAPAASTRPTSPAPAPPPPRSEDDLFLEEMSGTRRLDDARSGRVGAPLPDPRRRAPPRSDDAEVLASLADLCGGDGPFDISATDEYVEGIAEGIDRRLLRRLRAGEYAVQAHIDLHGHTREEARERVTRFILDSRRAGRRCVLIVHGRGLHSRDEIPVLKQAVRGWLERGPTARSVLAFATARPCDGGAGAVYVLLRR